MAAAGTASLKLGRKSGFRKEQKGASKTGHSSNVPDCGGKGSWNFQGEKLAENFNESFGGSFATTSQHCSSL